MALSARWRMAGAGALEGAGLWLLVDHWPLTPHSTAFVGASARRWAMGDGRSVPRHHGRYRAPRHPAPHPPTWAHPGSATTSSSSASSWPATPPAAPSRSCWARAPAAHDPARRFGAGSDADRRGAAPPYTRPRPAGLKRPQPGRPPAQRSRGTGTVRLRVSALLPGPPGLRSPARAPCPSVSDSRSGTRRRGTSGWTAAPPRIRVS
jgi:hypothetical protein